MKDYKDVKLKMRLPTYFARSFHSHVMTDLQTFVKLQQLGGPNGEDLERCEASTSKVGDTVDASENPVNSPVEVQVVNIPLFIGFLYIPGGARFQPSTVHLKLVISQWNVTQPTPGPNDWRVIPCHEIQKQQGQPHWKMAPDIFASQRSQSESLQLRCPQYHITGKIATFKTNKGQHLEGFFRLKPRSKGNIL